MSHSSFSLTKHDPKQSCPATLHNSNQVSFQQPSRKLSMAQFSHYNQSNRIDIDQVMVDIRLTPLKTNEFCQKIKTIYECLNWLRKTSPSLVEEVRTAELIVESIEAKWKRCEKETKRLADGGNAEGWRNEDPTIEASSKKHTHVRVNSSFKQPQSTSKKPPQHQDSLLHSKQKPNILYSEISPIKQLDQATSRIVYTNFSIKQLETSCKKQQSHKKPTYQRQQSMDSRMSNHKAQMLLMNLNHSQSTKEVRPQSGSKPRCMHKKEGSVLTVSVFDAEDEEMERLQKNIQALDRVLEQKGCLGITVNSQSKANNIKREQNNSDKINGSNKMALKEVTLNSTKNGISMMGSNQKSEKKGGVFAGNNNGSTIKQKLFSNNKENY